MLNTKTENENKYHDLQTRSEKKMEILVKPLLLT